MSRLRVLIAVAFVLSLPLRFAYSQGSTASVNGTVRDQTGAVIVGAKLTLTNTAKGTKVETASNEAGIYVFPGVVPGPYSLEVQSPGMERYQAGFVAEVAQNLTIDPMLKPGSTATTVEIKDVTPMVNLTDSTASHILENQDLDQFNFKANGRQLSAVLVMVPGMSGTYQADGLRYGSTDWSLDGAPLTDRAHGTIQNRQPGIDSIQEMTIDTNNVSAKYNSPVVITMSTKSGSNAVHGSLFEVNSNSGLYYARLRNQGNVTPSYSNRNEFGASMGGPVYIPKVYNGKSKTFWFFAWESRRQISNSYVGYSVPTAAMRAGDYSGLVDSNGRQTQIYDPWTTTYDAANGVYLRQQFNYGGKLNAIDPSRASPLWSYLMKITPTATLPNVNPLISSNWYGNAATRWNDDTYSTRVDQHFSDRDLFYARYSKNGMLLDVPFSGAIPLQTNDANRNAYTTPAQSLATSYVHLFSPSLFNELLVSAFRQAFYQSSNPGAPKDYDAILGLANPFHGAQWPDLYSIGLNGSLWRTVYPNADHSTFYQINDNLTKIAGKHQLMAGVHLRRDYVNYLPQQGGAAGGVIPVANWTALWNPTCTAASPCATPYTGSTIASAYLGENEYVAYSVHKYYYERQNQYGLYFQDNYKITPRLTLNLGVRWEAWPAMHEKYDNTIGFDPSTGSVVLTQPTQSYDKIVPSFAQSANTLKQLGVPFETYQQAGLPRALQYGNWKDFSPRVSFAYRLTGGNRPLVLRAGFTIAYYPIQIYSQLEQISASIPMTNYYVYYPDHNGYYPDGKPGWSLRNTPTYVAGLNTLGVYGNAAPGGLSPGNLYVSYLDPHAPDTRVSDGNITLEKEILDKTVLRVAWIANHDANLDTQYYPNPQMPQYVWAATKGTPYPTSAGPTRLYNPLYGTLYDIGRMGYGNYSGIHVELEHRYSNGNSWRIFYVNNNAYALGNINNQGTSVTLLPSSYYLPSQVSGWSQDELNRQINYARDQTFPHRTLTWNWVAAIPVGRHQRFFGSMRPWLDTIVGGWQFSGIGSWNTGWWSLQSSQFRTGAPLRIYGHSVQVQDCRSGTCLSAYLYSNGGWINPAQVNQINSAGQCIGICGIPSDYQSFSAPLVTDPTSKYFGTNTVTVPLSNGTNWIGAWGGLSPLNNQIFESPGLWTLNASLFKDFPIKERMRLRLQWDVRNPTNSPEEPNGVNANGLIYTYGSGQAARNMQLMLRLIW